MTKLAIIITSIFVFLNACNQQKASSSVNARKINFYDSIENDNLKILDSLHLANYNDSAKWELYTIHCDDTIVQKKDNKYSPVSALNLKLTLVDKTNDTLNLLYHFMENDTVVSYSELKGGLSTTDGVEFKVSENRVIGYIKGEGLYTETGKKSRYQSILQPEVIGYIKTNYDKLNQWFENEAKRRGIVN
jgi:hypothetical protein